MFLYHGDSRIALEFMGQLYYYLYNLQGDVVGLVDKTGTTMVSYTYDVWGKPESTTGPMATTLGVANPFRYRGYYYDTESGFYYLQSRYYDPEVGRFLNADGTVSTGQGITGTNMFAYCGNNPVDRADASGRYWIGNLSGRRYDTLSCTTRYEMQLYDGGIQNCTKYPDVEVLPPPSIILEDFHNEDGTYSLYDNKRHNPDQIFHEQLVVGSYGYDVDLKDGMLGGGVDLTLISGGWETKHIDLSLLDFGTASLYAGKSKSFVGVGAMVSAWSPEITISVFGWDLSLGADVGSIGAEAGLKDGGFHAGFSYVFGGHISIAPSNK